MTSREVLIVDDDLSLSRLLEVRLQAAGYPASKAASGAEGLAMLRASAMHVVLVDYDMPGMNGIEFCRMVRADKSIPFTHLIIVTAHTDQSLLVEALDAGADDFIRKPVDRAELLARVRAGERTVDLHRELDRSLRLQAERDHLRQSVAAMEHVLGVVGHELRTPLAALRAIAEFLLTGDAMQMPESTMFLKSLHDEVVRMSDTVDSLLEAARMNSGRARWNWSKFSLMSACEEAMETARPLIDASRVNLSLNVEPEGAAMSGDADAVRRLVMNLLSNARKHTTDGEIAIDVRTAEEAGQGWVRISVRDTGPGIAPEILSRLGEAFALNAGVVGANHVNGTGLGLAICKGVVAAHGGSLGIDSELGRGTTITAHLRADLTGPCETQERTQLFNPLPLKSEGKAA
jgi:two-component system, sensor histidine kinase and response regulator